MVNFSNKKVIVHVLANEPTGGVGTFLKETLTTDYHYMIIETVLNERSEFNDLMQERGISIHAFPSFKQIVQYVKKTQQFYKENAYRISAIHIHSTAVALIHLYYAKKYGVKIRIMHLHSAYYTGVSKLKKIRNKIVINRVFKFSTHIVTCGQLVGNSVVKNKTYDILPNTFNTNLYHFNAQKRQEIRSKLNLTNQMVFGCVGRYAMPKNQAFLINLVKRLNNQNIILLLIGEGEDRKQFEQFIQYEQLHDCVILTGHQTNIIDWYSAIDVLLMPSFWEGFPLTAIEAQATGLPCLLSNRVDSSVKVLEQVHFLSIEDENEWLKAMMTIQINDTQTRNQANEKVTEQFHSTIGQQKLVAYYKKLGL